MIRLLAILALAACASAPPAPTHPGPPEEMWARCPMICEVQGSVFLGVLSPTPEGPFICACAKKPEATPQSRTWDT